MFPWQTWIWGPLLLLTLISAENIPLRALVILRKKAHNGIRICKTNDFVGGCGATHHLQSVSPRANRCRVLLVSRCRLHSQVHVLQETAPLRRRTKQAECRGTSDASSKISGNDAKHVLQFGRPARSGTRCVYSNFHLRRTATWERKKIMSRSLWAAYRKHSAVSSSKISLCWQSTIWWRSNKRGGEGGGTVMLHY